LTFGFYKYTGILYTSDWTSLPPTTYIQVLLITRVPKADGVNGGFGNVFCGTNLINLVVTGLQIIENGKGYVMDGGDVYFAVDTLPTYGCLSGRKQEENRAGERVTVDTRKQNPADFALWKVSALASGERKILLLSIRCCPIKMGIYSQVLCSFRDHLCD